MQSNTLKIIPTHGLPLKRTHTHGPSSPVPHLVPQILTIYKRKSHRKKNPPASVILFVGIFGRGLPIYDGKVLFVLIRFAAIERMRLKSEHPCRSTSCNTKDSVGQKTFMDTCMMPTSWILRFKGCKSECLLPPFERLTNSSSTQPIRVVIPRLSSISSTCL